MDNKLDYKEILKNPPVHIVFLDHAKGVTEAIECEALGWIVSETLTTIGLAWWVCKMDCPESAAENSEVFCVVRTAISKRSILSIKSLK